MRVFRFHGYIIGHQRLRWLHFGWGCITNFFTRLFSLFFCGQEYRMLYLILMNNPIPAPTTPQALLTEIAAIQQMERGKISVTRQTAEGPLYNHQTWEKGKNVSR